MVWVESNLYPTTCHFLFPPLIGSIQSRISQVRGIARGVSLLVLGSLILVSSQKYWHSNAKKTQRVQAILVVSILNLSKQHSCKAGLLSQWPHCGVWSLDHWWSCGYRLRVTWVNHWQNSEGRIIIRLNTWLLFRSGWGKRLFLKLQACCFFEMSGVCYWIQWLIQGWNAVVEKIGTSDSFCLP